MSFFSRRGALALAGASVIATGGLAVLSPTSGASAATARPSKHVMLISIDGMHQSDLTWWVKHYPTSTLALLAERGTEYANAHAANPSDSDPGGTAIMTGGNPKSTGVYYDVEYAHSVNEPTLIGGQPSGAAACTPGHPATGGDVIYDAPDDKLPAVPDLSTASVNAGNTYPAFDENGSVYPGGVDTDPAKILKLKNNATSFNWGNFPLNPATCKPISPWDYLGDNSIFQVIHAAHLRTAWSDKHAIYMSFNGPHSNGRSIDDFFGPEIDSQAVMPNGKPYLHPDGTSDDWAHIDAAAKQYDGYKVKAILNEINGYDHSGTTKVGTPAVFGMNFQTVSVAQKIPLDSANLIKTPTGYVLSAPQAGGYTAAGTPGPVLTSALGYVNAQLTALVHRIKVDGLAASTTIIITAKHGQSPTDPSKLRTIKDGPIVSAINAAWAGLHPSNTSLIVAGTNDDLWQSYLSGTPGVTRQAEADFVVHYLMTHSAAGADIHKNAVTVAHSGVAACFSGSAVAVFFGKATATSPKAVTVTGGRNPDVFCRVQEGVVYTKPGKKLAEHGGMNPQDQHVLMIVTGAGAQPRVVTGTVETSQVAPTILRLLGLNPRALRAVQVEGTRVLPGIA